MGIVIVCRLIIIEVVRKGKGKEKKGKNGQQPSRPPYTVVGSFCVGDVMA